MAVNPMNNKNLSRTHSKELAKNNRGKRTRKNSDYKTTATAARQAQSQTAQRAPWPTKVKVTLGILFGILVAALILRLAVPSVPGRGRRSDSPCAGCVVSGNADGSAGKTAQKSARQSSD